MGKIILNSKSKILTINGEKTTIEVLDNKEFNKFNPQVLGLGDISLRSTQVEAIAAVFDLSGFTHFCTQVDPHLSVPEYLSRFLNWLFNEMKKDFVQKSYPDGKELWADLPFLAKFLGDGVLFLWDCNNMNGVENCNIVISLKNICDNYLNRFYPKIKKVVVDPPNILRCGVARGRVFSVGNGEDYVGPCINIASRLQKFSLLTFCFSRRGFDFDEDMIKKWASEFVVKSVSIRGIGENELICVLKSEFDNLPKKEKELFRAP